MNHINKCEYCSEFNNDETTSFNKIYSPLFKSRVITETDTFKVIPTLGQLFNFSLLIIPKYHIETLSQLQINEVKELSSVFKLLKKALSQYGHVVAFEHGARCESGGGCGIYHAHLHIVPLPIETNLSQFLKHNYSNFTSLLSALDSARNKKEYLLAINKSEEISVLDLNGLSTLYPSQFFRRELWKHFSLEGSWDWNTYNYPEKKLLDIVENKILRNLVELV